MSESVYAGLTSQTIDIFLADSSSTTGAGLTGLVYNSSGLSCYYRKGATGSATSVSLATQSVGGAWSSGGFVEVDSTNMPGIYRFDIPNAVVDTQGFVTIYFQGATNLVPTALRVDCRPIPSDLKKIQSDATSVTDFKSLVDADFNARTLPSGDYFNWSEDADFSSVETYIDGRTLPSGDYFNSDEDSVDIDSILRTTLTESNGGDLANNVSQFFDVNPTTTNTVDDIGGGSSLTGSGIADEVWGRDLTSYNTADTAGRYMKYAANVTATGTAASNGGTTSFISNLSTSTNDYYDDHVLVFTSGNNIGVSRVISNYTGSTKTIQFDEPLTTAVSSGEEFVIYGLHAHTKSQLSQQIWQQTTGIASALSGTFGYQLSTVLNNVPNNSELQARTLPSGDYFQWEDADFTDLESYIESRTLPSGDYNTGGGGGDATLANQESILSLLNYESGVVDAIYTDTNELQQNQGDWATADISSLATTTQLNSRTLPSGDYFNPSEDTVAHVTLVDTTTTNTDMRGTNGANTIAPDNASIALILEDSDELQSNQSNWVTADLSTLQTLIEDIPTNTEFQLRTLPSGDYFNWGEDSDFTTLESYIEGRTLPSGEYNTSSGGDATLANQTEILSLLNYESGVIDDIYADTNELQLNQNNWTTADTSSLATTAQLNSRTLPSGDYFNADEDTVNTDLSSLTTSVEDIPTNSEFQARTLPSGDYFNSSEDNISVDLSSITTLLNDMPTNSEFEARTLPSGDYLGASDVSSIVIESQGGYTLQQTLSIILSVLAGESEGSGLIFKTPDGNATRVTAVVDEDRNRTSITLNPSS